ncbi:MAG: T9SS type A sorting domain-containing protein [Candidatus Kapabacteria bacterium]|nr:T9SS type A sorting domain-containing protein [Ignavibacteriota bacterium]MCW5885583.1 T9SS type A sorting domain-containing protein [Candidatus Kapabacteria bacterium]
MKTIYLILLLVTVSNNLYSKTLQVGGGKEYATIRLAALQAEAGDTIFVYGGVHQGGMLISKLQGTADLRIFIIGQPDTEVIIRGGGNSIQFSDAKYVEIQGLIIENQTSNGMNIDDGGDYSTPAEFITISDCIFRDISATGNNDLLKMSGVDNFIIKSCIFENGSAGGSGVDMVGCHNGKIQNCIFKNMGSNAIQAKGGTQYIEIYANYFENCGQRTLNLGGSTGLQYFRPIDAKFEAADLQVYSNIFIGSLAPIAYVGSVRVDVINNTIINPERWVIRILQETVDESRFEKCGNNRFENNIIYFGNISTETNVGTNTAPETFTFRNNYWYNHQNPNWQGPNLPATEINQVVGLDPFFENFTNNDFRLKAASSARSYITYTGMPIQDYSGNNYLQPRSAGAFEFNDNTVVKESKESLFVITPNPASDFITIQLRNKGLQPFAADRVQIFDMLGLEVISTPSASQPPTGEGNLRIDVSHLPTGVYFVQIIGSNGACSIVKKFVKM